MGSLFINQRLVNKRLVSDLGCAAICRFKLAIQELAFLEQLKFAQSKAFKKFTVFCLTESLVPGISLRRLCIKLIEIGKLCIRRITDASPLHTPLP
jgi:hypothetical protein